MGQESHKNAMRLSAVVSGRVQGVGYRVFVARHAREHELTGTVRNLSAGEVEVEAEGSREALESLLQALRRGPTGARVERVDATFSEAPARYRTFEITF